MLSAFTDASKTPLPTYRARLVFADRLKAARLAAGLTQQGLGVLIGLSPEVASTRVNRYERAIHDCDLETADRLATALDVPLASLYAETAELSRLIAITSSLPPEQIAELVARLEQR